MFVCSCKVARKVNVCYEVAVDKLKLRLKWEWMEHVQCLFVVLMMQLLLVLESTLCASVSSVDSFSLIDH